MKTSTTPIVDIYISTIPPLYEKEWLAWNNAKGFFDSELTTKADALTPATSLNSERTVKTKGNP
ncbi:MAG: hypothetical protein HY098_07285 [Nitrospinae bacterium]|nr:hypothetical protein [Nitrospinota bacterium]